MKRRIYSIAFIIALGGALFCSCSDDDPGSKSVIIDPVEKMNEFDKWLDENYRAGYNIQFKYKYEDIESNMQYELVPATTAQSIILAKLVKHLWLEPYAEVAGVAFMRTYTPRVLHVIGTVGYNINNGTYTLGTAEGGLKITLYAGNWLKDWFQITEDNVTLDIGQINYYYLHTMHHEFGHILHQTKDFSTDFKLVSSGDYNASWEKRSDKEAAGIGFISPYASSSYYEDFVETLSFYITLSDNEWAQKVALGGEQGAIKINTKLQYVKEYMQKTWNINLDLLKEVLARRYEEIYDIDWVNP